MVRLCNDLSVNHKKHRLEMTNKTADTQIHYETGR